jgi:adenosylcobinamide-phosphate synthase
MTYAIAILLMAVTLDLLLGDPPYRYHPARLMGSFIAAMEKLLSRLALSGLGGGTVLAVGTLVVFTGVYLTTRLLLAALQPWFAVVLDLYVTYSCLALTDLLRHAMPVAEALDRKDLSLARTSLQKIVGRDTAQLAPEGLVRGAVESVAENFVDGVLSPLFWYTAGAVICLALRGEAPAVAGVCAILCFKAINTLDSMVGYRHGRYLLFGRPSARLDDLANLIPARLSLLALSVGALLSSESARKGWKTAGRDRLQHHSPNAGHPESFMAGALGIKLGGPTTYPEGTVDKPWLGHGDRVPGPDHIRRACTIIHRSAMVSATFAVTGLWIASVLTG